MAKAAVSADWKDAVRSLPVFSPSEKRRILENVEINGDVQLAMEEIVRLGGNTNKLLDFFRWYVYPSDDPGVPKFLDDLNARIVSDNARRSALEVHRRGFEGLDDPTRRIVSQHATPHVPDLALLKDFLETKPSGLCFPLLPPMYEAVKFHDLQGMFSEGTPKGFCLGLETMIGNVVKPPSVGVTELSHIPLWNTLIHGGIQVYMAPSVPFTFDRNTSYETQTLSQLPDYVGYVGELYSLLRGEEKALRGPGDPKRELVEKLVWVYKHLPYLIGYHARGALVTFGALHQSGGKVECEDLVTVNLSDMTDRVRCQVILFNLGRVLAGLSELCKNKMEISDTLLVQEADPAKGGKSVVLSGYSVIKGYMDLNKATRVWTMYSRIQNCPNAEKCHTKLCPGSRKRKSDVAGGGFYTLTFSPRLDVSRRARPLSELLRALVHVSNALCFAHERRVMHRDVSWRNVGLDSTSNQWVLFDWDESSTSPTRLAAPALSCECHALETSRGRHDTAVDVWGLGWLIRTSKVTLTPELEELASKCLNADAKARPSMISCSRWLQEMLALSTRANKNEPHQFCQTI